MPKSSKGKKTKKPDTIGAFGGAVKISLDGKIKNSGKECTCRGVNLKCYKCHGLGRVR